VIAVPVELHLWASGNTRDFITVGMPDTAVRESRERIKSALLNSDFGYPPVRDHTVRAISAACLKHLRKWH
jgi:predicted ATPase with chaperone activity